MYRLALNMLFGDRAKLAMLLCGLAFSALLMAQQSSVFFGIMSWTYTPMVNIRAQVWVSDPMVEQVNDAKPLRDTDLGRVRSVDGVAWAAPLHTSFVQARMQDGNFKLITLVGIDADTFAGAPAVLSQGRIEDLRLPSEEGSLGHHEFVLVRQNPTIPWGWSTVRRSMGHAHAQGRACFV